MQSFIRITPLLLVATWCFAFTTPDGWPEDESRSFNGQAVPISDATRQVTVLFNGVPPNDYGVVALHDENKNMEARQERVWRAEGGFRLC
jgi:uncharacterized protein (DUF2141 family)